ncbi:MAG TPA: hypothetical protein VFB95_01280 [Candidatus Cryosericum sp.]|nr:hypothetical protein [Candidatus Cryosericum sp.]
MSFKSSARLIVLAAVVLFAFFGESFATCGSANCFLITGTQEGVAEKGRVVLDLSFRYVPQDRRLDGRDGTDEVLAPAIDFDSEAIVPDHHREIETLNELVQVDLAWGVSARLSVTAALPLLNHRYHEHFDDVGTPEEAFSNSAGTTGFGDLRLGVRQALLVRPQDLLVGSLSVELPTGPYRLRDDEGAIGEPTLMPGSGSTDLVLALHYAHVWGESGWEGFVSGGWKRSGRNPLEYRMGDERLLNAGLERRVGAGFTWSLQINGRSTGRDDYLGESVPSTGALLVNLTPGLRVMAREGETTFYLFAQVPVFQDVNEAQLAPRLGLLLGFSKAF